MCTYIFKGKGGRILKRKILSIVLIVVLLTSNLAFTVQDLSAKITEAENLYNSTEGGNDIGQYPPDVREGFLNAINSAKAVDADSEATEEEKDQQYYALSDAMTAYNDAEITSNSIVFDMDDTIVSGAAIEAFVVGYIDGGEPDLQPYQDYIDAGTLAPGNAMISTMLNYSGESYNYSDVITINDGRNVVPLNSNEFVEVAVNYDIAFSSFDETNLLLGGDTRRYKLKGASAKLNTGTVNFGEFEVSKGNDLYRFEAPYLESGYTITTGASISIDLDLTLDLRKTEYSVGDMFRLFEILDVTDTNGNLLRSHEEISEVGDPFATFTLLQDSQEAFSDTIVNTDEQITIPDISSGEYTLEIEFFIDGTPYSLNQAVTVGSESPDGDGDGGLQNLSYNDSEGYFEFETTSVDVSNSNLIMLNISSEFLEGTLPSSGKRLYDNVNLEFVKVNSDESESVITGAAIEIEGYYKNADNPSNDDINIQLRSTESLGLESSTTYRIKMRNDIDRAIFNQLLDNFYLSTDRQNVRCSVLEEVNNDIVNEYSAQMKITPTKTSEDSATVQNINTTSEVDLYRVGTAFEVEKDTTAAFATVDTFKFVMRTEETLSQEIPLSLEINDTQTVDGVITTNTTDGITKIVYTFDVEGLSVTKLELDPDSFEEMEQLIYDVNKVIVGYNSSSEINYYNYLDRIEEKVVVDPELGVKISDQEDVPEDVVSLTTTNGAITITGRLEEDNGGYRTINFNVTAENTGISNVDHIAVMGTSAAAGEDPIEFAITAEKWSESLFSGDFHFTHVDSEHLNLIPTDFDPVSYRQSDTYEHYDEIPVYTGMKNTVTFEIESPNGDTDQLSFDWYPNSIYDIMHWANVSDGSDGISPTTESLSIDINNFYGDANNLTLELFKFNESQEEVTVGESSSVLNTQLIEEEYEDENGDIHIERYTRVTFDASNIDVSGLLSGQSLFAKLHYTDEALDLDFSKDVEGQIEVDTQGPQLTRMDFWEKTDSTYSFIVGFDELIDDTSITPEQFVLLDEDNQPIYDSNNKLILPDLIEPYWEHEPEDMGARELLLTYNNFTLNLMHDYKMQVNSIYDLSGNESEPDETEWFSVRTFFSGYLRDSDLSVLKNTEVEFMIEKNYESLKSLLTKTPEELLTTEKIEFDHEGFRSDANGKINQDFHPGNYYAFGMRTDVDTDDEEEMNLRLPVFSIPLLSQGESVSEDIVLQEPNVAGSIDRTSDYSLKEVVTIYEDGVFDKIKEVKQYMNATELTSEEEKILHEIMWKWEEVLSYTVETNLDGTFDIYLRPGAYEVVALGEDFSYNEFEQPVDFSVVDGQVTSLSITNPEEPNVFITLKDYEGDLFESCSVLLKDIANEKEYDLATNSDGILAANLSLGTEYQILTITKSGDLESDGFYYNLSEENITITPTAENNEFDKTINISPNYLIDFVVGEEKLKTKNWMRISLLDMGSVPSVTGHWDLYLPTGETYTVNEYEVFDTAVETNQVLSVGENTIDLSGLLNYRVRLEDDASNGLEGREVHIEIADDRHVGVVTNAQGNGYFYINPEDFTSNDSGEYIVEVHGYDYNDKYVNFEEGEHQLALTDDDLIEGNMNTQTITVIPPNFKGSVKDSEGNILFKDGWISIEKTDLPKDEFHQHINQEGVFEFSIDEVGTYKVRDVGDFDSYMEINYTFEVITQNSKYVVVDSEGTPIDMPIELGERTNNFRGKLYKSGTTPFATEGHISMTVLKRGVDERIFSEWIPVETDGSFSTYLTPGSEYYIANVYTDYSGYDFENGIDIELMEADQIIRPSYNFTGTVTDYEGNKAIGGGLNLVNAADEWDHVRISSDGTFSKEYEPGAKYTIQDVWFETEGNQEGYWMRINQKITIGENTTGLSIGPNTKGTITFGDTETLTDVGIRISPIFVEEDFDTTEEYQAYLNEPWKYDMWLPAKVINGNQAVFYAYLPKGDYAIRGIDVNHNFSDMNKEFTVDTDTYILDLDLNSLFNVTGTIKDKDGQLVDKAWVEFEKYNSDWSRMPHDTDHWYGTKASDGEFKMNLASGNYELKAYHTEGYWENGQWHEGDRVSIKRRFVVKEDDSIEDLDGNPIESFDISVNFSGTIEYYDNGTYKPLVGAWMNIYPYDEEGNIDYENQIWADTGRSSNEFAMVLPTGDYLIEAVGNEDRRIKLDKQVTIGENSLDQVIREETPNFAGTVYKDDNEILKWGVIILEDNQMNITAIETDENGTFQGKLGDGTWKIIGIGTYNYWRNLNIELTVSGNNITSEFAGFSSSPYEIYPPSPNLIGRVKDEQNEYLEDMAWVHIKSMDTGKSMWFEQRNIEGEWKFEARLTSGDYKIIEVGSMQMFYRTDIDFTITNGETTEMEAYKLQPNFNGTVYSGSDAQSDPVSYGWIKLMRVDSNGNQVTLEGNALDTTNIDWSETLGSSLDGNGYFEMIIEEGVEYKIVSAGNAATNYNPDMTIDAFDEEVAVVKPGDNFTLTLTNVPTALEGASQAWINIYTTADGEKEFKNVKFVEKTVDNEFKFSGRLTDGTYTLSYLVTDQGDMILDEEIIVDGSTDETISLAADTNERSIDFTFTINEEAITESVLITITDASSGDTKTVKTTASGQATLILPKETTWNVTSMGTKDGYFELSGQEDIGIDGQSDISVDISK